MFAKIQSIIIYCPLKIHFWHCPLFGARTDDVRVNGRRNARIGFVFLCRGLQLEMFRMLLNESNYRYNNRYNECNNLDEKYWYIYILTLHCFSVVSLFSKAPELCKTKPKPKLRAGPHQPNTYKLSFDSLFWLFILCTHSSKKIPKQISCT